MYARVRSGGPYFISRRDSTVIQDILIWLYLSRNKSIKSSKDLMDPDERVLYQYHASPVRHVENILQMMPLVAPSKLNLS
jgi:hypothetical protein